MLYIFLSGILWGTIGIFVNALSSLGVSVPLMSFLRMLFAFIIMSSLALIKLGRKVFVIDAKTLLTCALLGLISQGAFNIFYSNSIKLNGVGVAAVLMYSAPVFTGIACRLIFHEKFSGLKLFALALNIIGCILTVTGGNFTANNISLAGILYGLGSGFGYGMVAVFGKLAGQRTDAIIVSSYSYLFALIFLGIFTAPPVSYALGNAKILLTGFLYGLIPTSLAYLLYYNGLKKINNTSLAPVIASIEPVTAVIIGVIIYNEVIGMINLTGFAIVLISIIIIIRTQ